MMNLRKGIILLICFSVWGCSSGNDSQITLDASGKHPAGWAVTATGGMHPVAYQANHGVCDECHGSSQIAASSGGISGVSCFSTSRSGISCHPGGPTGGHPAGWSAPGSHGTAAKALAPGLGSCTGCHGSGFTGGAGKSCLSCHTTAPHPVAPWRGTTATGSTHTTVDPANAAECARCHINNQRLVFPQPLPVGANPDCFNNSLCHGTAVGHPAGWSASGKHGVSAKATPNGSQGFAYCTGCHGADFISGSGTSCKSCHTTAPHPAAPWRSVTGSSHTTTDPGNAGQCGRCHLNNQRLATPVAVSSGITPGCFDGTLCHAASGVSHVFPNTGSAHRIAGATTGDCQGCHNITSTTGNYPVANGTPPNCAGCHKLSLFAGCSDCHGDATTGRPSGSAFPNIRGRHSSPGEHAVACTTCHAGGGSGTSAHGNSNRIIKTAADVILNGTSSGMNIVRSGAVVTCTGTCHSKSHNGKTW